MSVVPVVFAATAPLSVVPHPTQQGTRSHNSEVDRLEAELQRSTTHVATLATQVNVVLAEEGRLETLHERGAKRFVGVGVILFMGSVVGAAAGSSLLADRAALGAIVGLSVGSLAITGLGAFAWHMRYHHAFAHLRDRKREFLEAIAQSETLHGQVRYALDAVRRALAWEAQRPRS